MGRARARYGGARGGGRAPNRSPRAARPSHFVATLAILLAGAGLGATTALLAAVPGRIGRREARGVAAGLLVMAVTLALLGESRPAALVRGVGPERTPVLRMRRAVRSRPLAGALLAGPTGGTAGRDDDGPLHRRLGLPRGSGGGAGRVPVDDVVHLAVWHGMPVAIWAAASMAVGALTLERWAAR